MAELSYVRLRQLLGEQGNRAARAEQQVRGLVAENAKLKAKITELQSLASPTQASSREEGANG